MKSISTKIVFDSFVDSIVVGRKYYVFIKKNDKMMER